jgi:glucose-6-phosphate isomerase
MQILYEKPLRIVYSNHELFVDSKKIQRDTRTLSQLKEVLRDHPEPSKEEQDMYYMFREANENQGISYDITVIPAQVIEKECAKTYGHSHPIAENRLSYPEIYQILLGEAVFLLQQTNNDQSVNVTLIKAKKGDVLIIPPNFSHVTINPGNGDLILSNLVAKDFDSDYTDFKTNRGAAVYYFPDGNIEQNANYIIKNIERPSIEEFNGRYKFEAEDLLKEFNENPQKFEFLKKPSLLFSD